MLRESGAKAAVYCSTSKSDLPDSDIAFQATRRRLSAREVRRCPVRCRCQVRRSLSEVSESFFAIIGRVCLSVLKYCCIRDGIPRYSASAFVSRKSLPFVSHADHGWPPALPLGQCGIRSRRSPNPWKSSVGPEPRADLTEILLRINFNEAFALEVIPRRRIRNVRLAGRR